MDFTKKNVRKSNIDDILLSIQSIVEVLYDKYAFLEIPKVEYLALVKKLIEESKNEYNGKIDYLKYICGKIEEELSDLIKERKTDSDGDNQLFEKYIAYTAENIDDYLLAMSYLEKLCDFCDKYKILPNFDTILRLITTNQAFSKIVGKVVDKQLKRIENIPLDKIFSNDVLCSIIEAFCMLKNIEILDISVPISDFNEKKYSSDGTYMYLQEIGAYPKLSLDDERILAIRSANGDNDAKKRLVECNLKLVVSIAKKYLNNGCQLIDLVQEGNIGLMKAVDRYDVNRGVKFATYATYWIRQAITRYIADKSKNIRIPIFIQNKINKYNRAIISLESRLHRSPTLEEIAQEMDTSIETVKYLAKVPMDTVSINSPVKEDDDSELVDFIPDEGDVPEDIVININITEELKRLFEISKLSKREIEVLSLRYGLYGGDPLTLEKIGASYNLTRERIRQIEAVALKKIRKSNCIRDFSIYMQDPSIALENIKLFRRNYKLNPETKRKYSNLQGLEEPSKKRKKGLKTMYELLGYPKKEVDELIAKLSEEERKLILLRNGVDLENPTHSAEWDNKSSKLFHNYLLPKMRRILSQNRTRNNNLDNALTLDNSSDSENLTVSIDSAHESISTTTKLLREDFISIQKIMNSAKFKELLTFLKPKEALIVCLRLGVVEGKCFSITTIAHFLNMSENDTIEMAKIALENYKKKINQFLNNAESIPNEKEDKEHKFVIKPVDSSFN